jgi:hypothetical protein
VFKKYSQMKREALKKLNRQANEGAQGFDGEAQLMGLCHGFATVGLILSSFYTSSRCAASQEVV